VKVRPFLILLVSILFIYPYAVTQLPKSTDSSACQRCHAMEFRTFIGTPHQEGKGCEGCHGPAEKHLRSTGDESLMFSYRRATAEEVRARCGQCHKDPIMSKHAEGDVACTSCHSAHHYVRKKYLLKTVDPEMKPA
jgi:hypothetical protein